MRPLLCPLCRSAFTPRDVRRLCVDNDGDAASPTTLAPRVDAHVQRLLCDIANAAGGNPTIEATERMIEQCHTYHNTQPHADGPVRDKIQKPPIRDTMTYSLFKHTPLGVSYLLLSTLLEAQRKLLLQADQISELSSARDDIHDRLTSELVTSQLRYHRSEEARLREKETALLHERIFEAQYMKVNAFWKWLVQITPRIQRLD